jgi:hypothetical protein
MKRSRKVLQIFEQNRHHAKINSGCVSKKTPGLRRRSLKKWLKIQLVNKTGRWVCDL